MKRSLMKLNKDKRIGRVLFIVEGSHYEFVLLKRIFCNIFGFSYIEKRRNKADYYVRENDPYSRIAVINTQESNIKDITDNETYLENIYAILVEDYKFPVDQSAVYYLFDRDPDSNTDIERIQSYIVELKNPYENENFKAGQLLLSYPSLESYTVSCFKDNSDSITFKLGSELKSFIGTNTDIQMNKIDESKIEHATLEFKKFLENENITLNIDDFSGASSEIFEKEEAWLESGGLKLFSMLTLAFLQLGIIEI